MQEVEIKLSGKVQGVNFRRFVKEKADLLNVRGYIENQEDGTVEILAQGESGALEEFIEHCKKGPMFAEIADVDISWHDRPQDSFLEFEVW